MNLNEIDIKRFYHIYFSLLDYTNEKYRITSKVKNLVTSDKVNPQDISPIREKLWENNEILDEVVDKNPFGFSSSDLEVINSWNNRIADKFILLKHLKNYSIMMGGGKLYGVTGIVSPFSEMFPSFVLPLFVDAVLIPFEGKIIYDSLLIPYNVRFGGGAKRGFNEEYRETKEKNGIITTLA